MKNRNFKSIVLIIATTMAIFYTSCNKNDLDTTALSKPIDKSKELISSNSVTKKIKIASLNNFSKSFALSLNNLEFRNFVERELKKEWGGDIQFLVNDIFESKIHGQKKFQDYIVENGLDAESKADLLSSKKVRILAMESTFDKINQFGFKNVLVVEGEGESKTKSFFSAYELTGKKIKIDASKEPEVPVFVVNSCEVCDDNELTKLIPEPKKGSLRRSSGQTENITYFLVPNISDIEGWNYGRPEIRVLVTVHSLATSSVLVAKDGQLPSRARSSWEAGINFSLPTNQWYLFNWYFATTQGPSYFIKIWEWDDDGEVLNLTWSVPISGGGSVGFTYSGIKDGDEQMDGQLISFPDPEPNTYNPGICQYKISSQ